MLFGNIEENRKKLKVAVSTEWIFGNGCGRERLFILLFIIRISVVDHLIFFKYVHVFW